MEIGTLFLKKNADYGLVHPDQYNATSFPTGTVNHVAKWTNENTSPPSLFVNFIYKI